GRANDTPRDERVELTPDRLLLALDANLDPVEGQRLVLAAVRPDVGGHVTPDPVLGLGELGQRPLLALARLRAALAHRERPVPGLRDVEGDRLARQLVLLGLGHPQPAAAGALVPAGLRLEVPRLAEPGGAAHPAGLLVPARGSVPGVRDQQHEA